MHVKRSFKVRPDGSVDPIEANIGHPLAEGATVTVDDGVVSVTASASLQRLGFAERVEVPVP